MFSASLVSALAGQSKFYLNSSPSSYTGYNNNYGGLGPLRINSADGYYWFKASTIGNVLSIDIGHDIYYGWSLDFSAPSRSPLVIGKTYENAERFTGVDTPGFAFYSPGRGSNQSLSSFIVHELEIDPATGIIKSAAVDFTHYDEKIVTRWNIGELRYNSDFPTILAGVKVSSPKGGESWTIGTVHTVSNDAQDLGASLPGVAYILAKAGVPLGSLVPIVNTPSVPFEWQTGQYKTANSEILMASPGSDYSIQMYWSETSTFSDESGFFSLVSPQQNGGGGGGGGSGVVLATFGRDLSLGSTGEDVRILQKILNQSPDTKIAETGLTSPGQENSYFGPATEAALKKWQAKYGFEVTGVTGPQTRSALNALLAAIAAGGGSGGVEQPVPSVVIPPVEPPVVTFPPMVIRVDVTEEYLTDEADIRVGGRLCGFFLKKPLPFEVTIDLVIGGRSHWQFDSEDVRFVLHRVDRTFFLVEMPERLVEELAGRKPEVRLIQ